MKTQLATPFTDTNQVFGHELEVSLGRGGPQPLLIAQLSREIEKTTSLHNVATSSKNVDLDKLGTRLWNTVSKVKGNKSIPSELQCLVRVFACSLIDCAQRGIQGSISNEIRILKTCLKTARYCLDERQLGLSQTIVERAASYEQILREKPKLQQSLIHSLSKQYIIVRISLAWRQGRLDLAKLMLVKLNTTNDEAESYLAEELADLLLEIGKDQVKASHGVDALQWLESARHAIDQQHPDGRSTNAVELRQSIMQCTVKCLILLGDEVHRTKAWNILQELAIEYGTKLPIQLMRLDLLASDPAPSTEDYRDTLNSIVKDVHLNDKNLNIILHHLHKLKGWDTSMAHAVLAGFLISRLIGTRNDAWIDKAMVTITWICTSSSPAAFEDSKLLSRTYDDVYALSRKPLGSSATHAVQILIWKRIEAAYMQDAYEVAEAWCHLSLHELLDKSGIMNVGKVQRKIMLCALAMSDGVKACETATTMSTANHGDPSTQYLLYKAALRCQDAELATRCLDSICTSSASDPTLVYACVLEAQRIGDSSQALACMQRVLERYDYDAPNGVHLPALLRCNARLLIRGLDSPHGPSDETANELCKVFEGTVAQAKRSRRHDQNTLFNQVELDWFSRNSYNLAVKMCTTWPPQHTLRLVQSCLHIIDLYPGDLDAEVLADLSLRRLLCNFLSGSLSIIIARTTDSVEGQFQHYLSARKTIADWRSHIPSQLSRLDGGAKADLQTKHTSLLAFDFEAAARLKDWDALSPLITESAECAASDPKHYAILADITLSADAPPEPTIRTLQHLINVTWSATGPNDLSRLSRWIRCLVALALPCADTGVLETLLEQVLLIIENAGGLEQAPSVGESYPPEELEWLATTVFNRGIDFYCRGHDAECRRWAERAVKLAYAARDDGVLHGILQEKFQALVWEDRAR